MIERQTFKPETKYPSREFREYIYQKGKEDPHSLISFFNYRWQFDNSRYWWELMDLYSCGELDESILNTEQGETIKALVDHPPEGIYMDTYYHFSMRYGLGKFYKPVAEEVEI